MWPAYSECSAKSASKGIALTTDNYTHLARYRDTRTTALFRLDMIARGAQLTYEDGTPIDMASEKARLEAVVADMDRRIRVLEGRS